MEELSLHILDLAQNSLTAGANVIEIAVLENTAENQLVISIVDDGCGMTEAQSQAVLDPFVTSRTTRKVGLGLPLLKLAAEQAGGGLTIKSELGVGTTVQVLFQHDHIDRAPLGDMAMTLVSILALNQSCRLRYRHRRNAQEFCLDSAEMEAVLQGVPLSHPDVAAWVLEYIRENESSLEV